jgi:hypothetical protein
MHLVRENKAFKGQKTTSCEGATQHFYIYSFWLFLASSKKRVIKLKEMVMAKKNWVVPSQFKIYDLINKNAFDKGIFFQGARKD